MQWLMTSATWGARPLNAAPMDWTVAGAIGVALLVLLAIALAFLQWTRVGIIARATTIEVVRQPLFWLAMVLGSVLILANTWIPFFSLGDDIKMFKDCGLATMLIAGLLLATWSASTNIADEIEGKTAITLLSKPITRWQFITGKYLGILQSAGLMLLPMTVIFLALIFYKAWKYDPREASIDDVTIEQALVVVWQVVPGILLTAYEVMVITAISVAISTRMPMAVNMVICFAVFVVGHLTPVLLQAGAGRFEGVLFMARLFATILPTLENFNIQASIATGKFVPSEYLLWAFVYAACYSGMALLLALIMFEDRDLA